MDRDFEPQDRQESAGERAAPLTPQRKAPASTQPQDAVRPTDERSQRELQAAESPQFREHAVMRVRGHLYRTSPAERATMRDIGRFRTVILADLARERYQGNTTLMQDHLRSLRSQGLVQLRTIWSGPKSEKLSLVALTKQGIELLKQGDPPSEQALYAGFVKPAEVRHDAAIYRMFQAERTKIEQAGGRIRRVVLDYELKQKVFSPLAKARSLAPIAYARRQAEVARQNALTVVEGKIPLPDLRIEYETARGDAGHVDLELATSHYHGPALAAKAQAGFKFYAADDSASRLSRVLEEREITASILSL